MLSRFASFIDDIPGVYKAQNDLENDIATIAMRTVAIAAATLFFCTIVAMLFSGKFPKLKLPLFVMMVIAMLGSTVTLIGSTIYLNVKSDSGGPIHWHADFEVWACGNELELRDPTGFLSNKIGTATLHEHNDHRIHLEGVAVEEKVDASLGKFMHVIGGAVTDTALVAPLNETGLIFEDEVDGDGPSDLSPELVDPYIKTDGELGKVAYFQDGQMCGDEASDVQVFVYKYNGDDKTFEQRKLSGDEVRDYVITQDPNVPPGDCIIMEFGPSREKTDKLCEQYGIRDISRCSQFGVEPDQREICELTQVNYATELTAPTDTTEETDIEAGDQSLEEQGVPASDARVQQSAEILELQTACEESGSDTSAECEVYNRAIDDTPATDTTEGEL